ncbi:hypothetical protein [Alkalihalobacillus trypoxylicola]|uniref:Uncharacterized protein n=1 Tax=Alkalihalobacillus trypoxylicola TaxID=519424 RepID=A0A162D0V1_9BACI|nr:hypothetical protein [Alkalihalobacillus trypoxylicola]KYG27638.1 hypothetical protein AZF04_10625 [Alkalihalobacillus trypoxylicola]
MKIKFNNMLILFMLWTLVGCSILEKDQEERTYNFDEKEIHEYLVPVQEYTGEGYRFRDSV